MIRVLLILVCCVAVAGCGGGGGSSSAPGGGVTDASAYAGHWVGMWTSVISGATGILNITIDDSGAVTGLMTTATGAGNVTGTISTAANLQIAVQFTHTLTVTGKVSINPPGHLVGSMVNTVEGSPPLPMDIDLLKQ